MPEVLTAPCVLTGEQTVINGAVVLGDRTVDWVGPAAALPGEHADLPRTDYPGAQVLAMATTEAAAALGVGAITGRLVPGYDADLIVVDGDPRTDITALGQLLRVIARGRDYLPDSGRFDVSAPGTPFAAGEHAVDLRLLTEATRPRRA